MARTNPVVELDATTGQAAIYLVDPASPGDRSPFVAPRTYAKHILFHSALDFMRVVYDEDKLITFPAVTGADGSRRWGFPNHNLGRIPTTLCLVGDTMVSPGAPFQATNKQTWRSFSLALTTSSVTLVETWKRRAGKKLPAFQRRVRVIILDKLRQDGSYPDAFLIDAGTETVQFGYGRFNNRGKSLIRAASSGTQFRIAKPGPTLDTRNGGVRHVGPNGEGYTIAPYKGRFGGSGGWPVKV